MAEVINVKSTVAQAEGFALEVEDSTLLGTRYFPNSDGDNFAGKEVLFDFDDDDLKRGVFATTKYADGNTVSWTANSVIPPRVGMQDSVDPSDQDRQIFERLCRSMGADTNRSEAYQNLLNIKAARLAKRADRSIESESSMLLKDGRILFAQDHEAGSGQGEDIIDCKFYNPEKGCNNHYVPANAWTSASATPYKDVCDMVTEGIKHGRRHTDLLMGANAWLQLSKDEMFSNQIHFMHTNGSLLDFGEIEGAQHVGTAVFNGVQLNLIVYSGAYMNASNELETFIDSNAVILISPAVGRCLCGGVTLLNPNSIGYGIENSFIGATGKHIQSIYKDFNNQKIYIREESRPLPAPKHSINSFDWIYCDTSKAGAAAFFGVVYSGVAFKCVNKSGETVVPTTAPACTATVVEGGASVTITPAATASKTYKYYESKDGEIGKEVELSGSALPIPVDTDRDENDKATILVVEQ